MTSKEDLGKALLVAERELMLAVQKVKLYGNSIQVINKNKNKCTITIKELEPLDKDHRTYRPLGRGFILKSKVEILEELEKVIKQNDKDIQEYQTNVEFYTKKAQDLEQKLKEMVAQYQALQAKQQ